MLEYASKFLEVSWFAPTDVENEKLKMNCFKEGFIPNLKERMLVQQFTSYEHM